MNWIRFSHKLPPDDDVEIFVRKIDASEWHQCPANECWFDVPYESRHEWEWALWKTIKLKSNPVGWDGYDPSAPNGFD